MRKITYISVKLLSEIINIHEKTLKSWLCHYSLSRFVKYKCNPTGKHEYVFGMSKTSIKALKKYLTAKKAKDLDLIDKKIQELSDSIYGF